MVARLEQIIEKVHILKNRIQVLENEVHQLTNEKNILKKDLDESTIIIENLTEKINFINLAPKKESEEVKRKIETYIIEIENCIKLLEN